MGLGKTVTTLALVRQSVRWVSARGQGMVTVLAYTPPSWIGHGRFKDSLSLL